MRHLKKAIFAALVSAAVIVAFAVISREEEPTYQGVTLSGWYADFSYHEDDGSPNAQVKSREAAAAVRAIGTNALPLLVRRIGNAPRGAMAFSLLEIFGPLPVIGDWIHEWANEPSVQADYATGIFVLLGAEAAPAIPDLSHIAKNTGSLEVMDRAIFSLAAIGDPAAPTLTNLLSDPAKMECTRTLYWLGVESPFRFSTNRSMLLSSITPLVTNQNPSVAGFATTATGHLGRGDLKLVPVLTNALKSIHPDVRLEALRALTRYDVPEWIQPGLADPSSTVRISATNFLWLIEKRRQGQL